MTRVALVLGILAVSLNAWAQAPADAVVEKALLAAPANLSKDATVVAFKPTTPTTRSRKARTAWSASTGRACLGSSRSPWNAPASAICHGSRRT